MGSLLGSYFGLFFLICAYTAIGIFASTLSNNQIVAFIVAIAISFLFFYGFDAMSSLFGDASYYVKNLGMNEHFKSMSRGVLDTRDLIYFISIALFFLICTKWRLDRDS